LRAVSIPKDVVVFETSVEVCGVGDQIRQMCKGKNIGSGPETVAARM